MAEMLENKRYSRYFFGYREKSFGTAFCLSGESQLINEHILKTIHIDLIVRY